MSKQIEWADICQIQLADARTFSAQMPRFEARAADAGPSTSTVVTQLRYVVRDGSTDRIVDKVDAAILVAMAGRAV